MYSCIPACSKTGLRSFNIRQLVRKSEDSNWHKPIQHNCVSQTVTDIQQPNVMVCHRQEKYSLCCSDSKKKKNS